jgi:hypothetical protein
MSDDYYSLEYPRCSDCGCHHKGGPCGHDQTQPCKFCTNPVGLLSTGGPDVCSRCEAFGVPPDILMGHRKPYDFHLQRENPIEFMRRERKKIEKAIEEEIKIKEGTSVFVSVVPDTSRIRQILREKYESKKPESDLSDPTTKELRQQIRSLLDRMIETDSAHESVELSGKLLSLYHQFALKVRGKKSLRKSINVKLTTSQLLLAQEGLIDIFDDKGVEIPYVYVEDIDRQTSEDYETVTRIFKHVSREIYLSVKLVWEKACTSYCIFNPEMSGPNAIEVIPKEKVLSWVERR